MTVRYTLIHSTLHLFIENKTNVKILSKGKRYNSNQEHETWETDIQSKQLVFLPALVQMIISLLQPRENSCLLWLKKTDVYKPMASPRPSTDETHASGNLLSPVRLRAFKEGTFWSIPCNTSFQRHLAYMESFQYLNGIFIKGNITFNLFLCCPHCFTQRTYAMFHSPSLGNKHQIGYYLLIKEKM